MTQAERDRLVALKKAKKKLITQKQAAEEIGVTERQVRRLLRKLRRKGDRAVIHELRGRASNRKLPVEMEQRTITVLSDPVYRGFGPTLAAEYLHNLHQITVSKETLRGWMVEAGLWKAGRRRVVELHQWRPRRSRCGELVQWDTSTHDWLEGRGETIYLISMIDDATSRLFARFVRHDTSEENMRLLWAYLERFGRPLAFYTDKAGMFQVAVKSKRQEQREGLDRQEMPPTQIARALGELGIVWIPAHSPQAKGRVERQFQTDQDRLVKRRARPDGEILHPIAFAFGFAGRPRALGLPGRQRRRFRQRRRTAAHAHILILESHGYASIQALLDAYPGLAHSGPHVPSVDLIELAIPSDGVVIRHLPLFHVAQDRCQIVFFA
jgi:hypothetical protein